MSNPPDAALLGRLLDEHASALSLYASQWTSAPDDSVQEAFVELARQPHTPGSPAAWLYRVVKHRALNAARGDRRRRRREEAFETDRLRSAATGGPAHERRLELAELIHKLDKASREIVILRVWGGLTLSETAEALGLSTSTIHRRYQAALSQLRNWWDTPCRMKNDSRTN